MKLGEVGSRGLIKDFDFVQGEFILGDFLFNQWYDNRGFFKVWLFYILIVQ